MIQENGHTRQEGLYINPSATMHTMCMGGLRMQMLVFRFEFSLVFYLLFPHLLKAPGLSLFTCSAD